MWDVTRMADIVYALDPDAGVTAFAADTKKGEEWLSVPTAIIPNIELPDYLADAKAAGLQVEPLQGKMACAETREWSWPN
jgi:hypothetical protein